MRFELCLQSKPFVYLNPPADTRAATCAAASPNLAASRRGSAFGAILRLPTETSILTIALTALLAGLTLLAGLALLLLAGLLLSAALLAWFLLTGITLTLLALVRHLLIA